MSARNQQLEQKVKEQRKEVDTLRAELATYSSRLVESESDREHKLDEERQRVTDELTRKQKYYDEVMTEMAEKHRGEVETSRKAIEKLKSQVSELQTELQNQQQQQLKQQAVKATSSKNVGEETQRLRVECESLRKQYDELKFSFDDLVDEKSQLLTTLNELKQRSSNSANSNDDLARLNLTIRVRIIPLINIIYAFLVFN